MNGLIGLFLVACAGGGIFFAFRSPQFVGGLVIVAVKALLPFLRPRNLTEAEKEAIRQGRDIATKADGHGGENR